MKENYFMTADLSLAAFVSSIGIGLEAVDKDVGGRATFIFPRADDLDDLVRAYWRQEARVEPQNYFSHLKMIKTRLYS